MAVVTVRINDKAYDVGCDDGAENQLRALAGMVDERARQIAQDGGSLGDTRLMLLTALVVAEEMTTMAARVNEAEDRLGKLEAELDEARRRVAQAIDAAAERIEAIGADW